MMRILLLGGTLEARELAGRFALLDDISATLSLAGVTSAPPDPGIPMRVGGFGGPEGLTAYLEAEQITTIVDATHPFASTISANAARAAEMAGIRRLVLWRPAWQAGPGDDWQEFGNWDDLIPAIPDGAQVFAAAGQDGMRALGRETRFGILARALKRPEGLPEHIRFLRGLPGKTAAAEEDVFRAEKITHLVAKNAGGEASRAKLIAAGRLGLPVLLLARPVPPPGELFEDVERLIAAL
ncbi:precorrin-6A/cobalt-precorrin-6A reductase [Alphaproteobacteria bacterium LSUCC0684]